MAQEKEKRNVVFRKIRGRIVPIALGSGLVGAGSAINKMKFSAKKEPIILSTRDQRMYNVLYKQDKLEKPLHIFRSRFYNQIKNTGLDPWEDVRPSGAAGSYLRLEPAAGKAEIRMASKSRAVFLHELGHAQQFKDGINYRDKWNMSFNPTLKKLNEWGAKAFSRGNKIQVQSQRLSSDLVLGIKNFGADILQFREESDAWVRAQKFAKTSIEKKAVKLGRKAYLPSYYKLINKKIGGALLIGGFGLIGYGLLKKGKQ